ncbi:glycosyltransferase [Patescibacteria group bacterium]|nr:glycosyltransferase [Patescibacteria group bacterium]
MIDKKRNIIMFNMSPYSDWEEGISNRNRHILQTLLKDESTGKIIAIDYLPWTWKKVIKQYIYSFLPSLSKYTGIYKSSFTSAREYSEKLVVVSSVANYFSKKKFWSDIKKIIKLADIDEYMIWSCNPMITDYFDELEASKYIFDAIDDWSLHPSYQIIKDKLQNNYALIAEKSDIIFTVASELGRKFNKDKTFWIPNGIDLNHYTKKYGLVDREIADIPKPIIGYIGVILGRLDLNIIIYLAENNPNKSIVLAGSYKGKLKHWDKELIKKLKSYKNIHLLGYIPYSKAPMYIGQFDVAIIPHRAETYVGTTNPMKMYEYFACGKPIIATPAPGINMFEEIRVGSTPEEFNREVIAALGDNSEEKAKERQALITSHTWTIRVNKMIELIDNHVS